MNGKYAPKAILPEHKSENPKKIQLIADNNYPAN
jgi:hypothetical protein